MKVSSFIVMAAGVASGFEGVEPALRCVLLALGIITAFRTLIWAKRPPPVNPRAFSVPVVKRSERGPNEKDRDGV